MSLHDMVLSFKHVVYVRQIVFKRFKVSLAKTSKIKMLIVLEIQSDHKYKVRKTHNGNWIVFKKYEGKG